MQIVRGNLRGPGGRVISMTWLNVISRPETLVFLVPIAAILVFGSTGIVKILIKHRERMAMIEQGMHPDIEAHESVEPHDVIV